MDDKIVALPGVTVRSQGADISDVIKGFVNNKDEFNDIVVLGRRTDGTLYIASSSGDIDTVAGMIARAQVRTARLDNITVKKK